MAHHDHLEWPFLEPRHRALAVELERWASVHLHGEHAKDMDAACRTLVPQLGKGGWLRHAVGGVTYGAFAEAIDTRAIMPPRRSRS